MQICKHRNANGKFCNKPVYLIGTVWTGKPASFVTRRNPQFMPAENRKIQRTFSEFCYWHYKTDALKVTKVYLNP